MGSFLIPIRARIAYNSVLALRVLFPRLSSFFRMGQRVKLFAARIDLDVSEPMVCQDPRGGMGSDAGGAEDNDFLLRIELA